MTVIKDFPFILHGGDWNPDQWLDSCPDILEKDFELMDKAHCNAFSLGIFSWGKIEVDEGKYDFSWLDRVMDQCAEHGKKIFLATPSAARPGWMVTKYPETGIANAYGARCGRIYGRSDACQNSPVYREAVCRIDARLAERYAAHPALAGWHISNEYCTECFCERCRNRFSGYLKERYKTLDELNRCYWSGVWSHHFTSWDFAQFDKSMDLFNLDWRRFVSDMNLEIFKMERDVIRQYSDAPASTNMMGTFGPMDYWKVAAECDFIGDDCYPDWYAGDVEREAARFAFLHDMHYTMKEKPFIIFESCPGIPQYHKYLKMRRPNEFVREMHLALGHGADGTMYFQWRKCRNNSEKFHGAVVGHDGSDKTLVFQRVADYGLRLERIREIADSRKAQPQAAVLFDWDNKFALDSCDGFQGETCKLEATVDMHYRGLWKHNIDLAVINCNCDFSKYKLLVLPMLFAVPEGVVPRLREFVKNGGTLVMTYLSAYVNEHNLCYTGGFPGGPVLRELFGIWNEDIDGLEPSVKQSFDYNGKTYAVEDFAEYIHAENADVLAVYNSEFYAGSPAVTCKLFGQGRAYYIAARTGVDFLTDFYGKLLDDCGIEALLENIPDGIEVSRRIAADGTEYYFVLNLTPETVCFELPVPMQDIWNDSGVSSSLKLPPCGSTVLKRSK